MSRFEFFTNIQCLQICRRGLASSNSKDRQEWILDKYAEWIPFPEKALWPHIFKDDEKCIPGRHPGIFAATQGMLFASLDPQKYPGSILKQAIALPLECLPIQRNGTVFIRIFSN